MATLTFSESTKAGAPPAAPSMRSVASHSRLHAVGREGAVVLGT